MGSRTELLIRRIRPLLLLLVVLVGGAAAFQARPAPLARPTAVRPSGRAAPPLSWLLPPAATGASVPSPRVSSGVGTAATALHAARGAVGQPSEGAAPGRRRPRLLRRLGGALRGAGHRLRLLLRALRFAAVAALLAVVALTPLAAAVRPLTAVASMPVMLVPKLKQPDSMDTARAQLRRDQAAKERAAEQDLARRAREIEATQGRAARLAFEKAEAARKRAAEAAQDEGLRRLKRDLLAQGIDPVLDIEGQRQVILFRDGVDMGNTPGTPFYVERMLEQRNSKQSQAYQFQQHRRVVQLMQQDMRNRGLDPVDYFAAHPEDTRALRALSPEQAARLAAEFEANMEQYGQVAPPKAGEKPVKETMATPSRLPLREASKVAPQKTAVKPAVPKVESVKKQAVAKPQERRLVAPKKSLKPVPAEKAIQKVPDVVDEASREVAAVAAAPATAPAQSVVTAVKVPQLAAAALAVAAIGGGGAFGLKQYREQAARKEAERQRQLRLLMGDAAGTDKKKPSRPTLDEDDELDLDSFTGSTETPISKAPATPAPESAPVTPAVPPAPKKKKSGLKGMFSRNKSGRETDIAVLVAPDAEAPEFATLLAKLLTFGAPGRFPRIEALPGAMPMEAFDLERAKEMLISARESIDLDKVAAAETFANVVNCMLIDIIDLASTTLKEKDTKVQVEALDVAIKFIEHAASMYDAVAEGVIISPVTYEGDLGRGKLESLYSAYVGSVMTNPTDDSESRLHTLQDIFKISDKKAEGIMMSAVQKNMMEMLKNGEGMEGMQEMLASMGGMPGMEGLLDPNGEPDTAQIKQMLLELKTMKDAGAIKKEDLETIKKEFYAQFGSAMDEAPEPLDPDTKEILELMKSMFED